MKWPQPGEENRNIKKTTIRKNPAKGFRKNWITRSGHTKKNQGTKKPKLKKSSANPPSKYNPPTKSLTNPLRKFAQQNFLLHDVNSKPHTREKTDYQIAKFQKPNSRFQLHLRTNSQHLTKTPQIKNKRRKPKFDITGAPKKNNSNLKLISHIAIFNFQTNQKPNPLINKF